MVEILEIIRYMLVSRLKYAVLVGLLFCLASCAQLGHLWGDDQAILKDRAFDRWQALIQKDWTAAYAYELPVYRKTHDENQFRARFGTKVQWNSIEVKDVRMIEEQKVAEVTLKLNYQLVMSDGQPVVSDSVINERWFKSDDNWWIAN